MGRLGFTHQVNDEIDRKTAEISQAVAQGAHAVLLMDQAGWHSSAKLKVPDNITIVLFPPPCEGSCSRHPKRSKSAKDRPRIPLTRADCFSGAHGAGLIGVRVPTLGRFSPQSFLDLVPRYILKILWFRFVVLNY